jgi:hypothetical protein
VELALRDSVQGAGRQRCSNALSVFAEEHYRARSRACHLLDRARYIRPHRLEVEEDQVWRQLRDLGRHRVEIAKCAGDLDLRVALQELGECLHAARGEVA